jgi:hypothetical protein
MVYLISCLSARKEVREMVVYAATRGERFEGSRILGIFRTREDARIYIAEDAHEMYEGAMCPFDPDLIDKGCDFWKVTRYVVR